MCVHGGITSKRTNPKPCEEKKSTMNKTTLFTVGALLAGTSANAAVLVGGTIDSLGDAAGNPLTTASKTMAIVDVDGDGLAGFDLANWDGSSFLPDADDWIVTDTVGANGAWFEAANDDPAGTSTEDPLFGAQPGILEVSTTKYQFDLVANTDTTVGAGDNVYLFWFPDLDINAVSPGANQAFGVVLLGPLDAIGGVNFFDAYGGGPIRQAEYSTLVPEPSSLALLGLGGLAMLRRRRA